MKKYLPIVTAGILLFLFQNTLFAQLESGSFDFDGHLRKYKVFLPQDYTGTINMPLVIYLHSYGWSAEQDMNYIQMNEVADTSGFIVAYPSGLPNWNSGISDNPKWPTTDVDDVGFINTLIDTLSKHYSIDTGKVFACGYSNGGFMSYKLACRLSNRISAIASVGGVMSESTLAGCNPAHPVRILEIHGTDDYWVPYYGGNTGWLSVDQTLGYWTNIKTCRRTDVTALPDLDPNDNCTVERTVYKNCDSTGNVILYKVIHGGHTWPGAGLPGFSNEGYVTGDINANVIILNFFKNEQVITSVENPEPDDMSKTNFLLKSFPNPFYTEMTISFQLPKASKGAVRIYNVLGQEIKTILVHHKPAGNYRVVWDGTNNENEPVPNGLYCICFSAMDCTQTILAIKATN